MRQIISMGLLTLAALLGCSNTVKVADGASGGDGGSGGAGGTGGTPTGPSIPKPVEPAVTEVRAPDQGSVRVQFNKDVAALLPADPAAFAISSAEVEPLEVKKVSYDATSRALTLFTASQKLGARYEL